MKKTKNIISKLWKILKINYTNKINEIRINVEYCIPCEITERTFSNRKKKFENWGNLISILIINYLILLKIR